MGKPKVFLVTTQKQISKENRKEWENEKRAKELHRRGYGVGNIEAMMDSGTGKIPAKKIEKWIKTKRDSREMRMDGRL